MKRRILSILCVLALCLGLLPSAAFAAGTDTGKSIQLADSETAANIGGGQADNIYFGNYFQSSSTTKEPVKWRVLSNSDGKLFLLSDQNLDVKPYNSSSTGITWEKSTIRSWLNGYAASENNSGTDYSSNNFIDAAFSSDEQVAIADTYVYNKNDPSYSTSGGEDTTDQIFLLSIEEANNSSYFPNGSNSRKSTNTAYVASYSGMLGAGKADYWWLRSPGGDDDYAAYVDDGGVVFNNGYIVGNRNTAVRPAFNLNLNSVLFTSAAAGGKSASGMDSGLTAVGGYDGNEWKLTLLDSSRNFSVTEETASGKPGDTITLNYTGASTGDNENISVILADDSGAQYYGRIAKPTTADGQVKITIPASLADGTYTLNVFSEQYNGGENDDTKLTDYASAFEAVTLTVDTTAPTLSNGSATRDSETTATVKFTSDEAGEYYYTVVESGATEPTDIVSGDSANMASGENTITLTNLTAGTKDIYIVAKDAAGNVSQQPLKIVIPKFIPTYTISASPAALNFSNKTVGYTEAPDGQTVTITNTGNQTVTVTLPTSTNYTITAGTGFVDGTATLALNGTANFTIQPKTGLAVGDYSETLTISSNHNTSAKVRLAFTVDPKSLDGAQVQVSGDYTYNGQEHKPSGSAVTVTLDGKTLEAGTDYTLDYENNINAGEATVTATAAENGNYTGTATGTFTIDPAPLTITGVTAEGRAYDGSNTVEITDVTLDGVKDGDDVSVNTSSLTGTLSSANAGTYTELTLTGTVNLTGADKGNYTLTLPTEGMTVTTVNDGSGVTISQATASISFKNYAPGKTYDGTALAVPDESQLTISGAEYNNVTFTWYKGSADDGEELSGAPADAGTYYLVASIPASDNTSGVSVTSEAITISPAEISIQSATLKTKTYNGTTAATAESVTFSGTTQPAETDYTVTAAAFADKTAGDSKTGSVTVTLTSGNFTFAGNQDEATYASATGTINKLPVVLEWSTTSFTYDGTEKTVTAEVANKVGEDEITLSYTGNTGTAVNSYTATVSGLSGNDASNYTLTGATGVELTWSIGGASIAGATVELSETEFTYTGQSQKPTVTVKLGENELSATTDYTVTYSGESKDAGTYTVTVTGTGSYSGTASSKPSYTIGKAAPTLAWSNTSQTLSYTGSQAAITAPTVTLVNDETYSGTISYQYKGQSAENYTDGLPTDVGTYTVVASIEEQDNYTAASGELTLTIEKAAASGTASAVTGLTYNGQAQNLVTADAVTGGTMQYSTDGSSYSADIPTGTEAKSYTVWYKVVGDENHNDSAPASVNVTIAQRPVELTWSDTTFTYDGSEKCPTATVNNKAIETDEVSVTVTGGQTNASDTAYTATATSLTGTAAGNYTLTDCQNTTQQFTIAKKPLTVSAPSKTITVGEAIPDLSTLEATVTGLVGEDTFSGVDLTYDGTPDSSAPGTWDIVPSGGKFADGVNEDNYIVSYVKGTLTVEKRPVSGGGTTTPSGPSTGGSDGWTEIEDEVDETPSGSTVTVDMNGTTEVPAAALETVAGKDVTLELDMGGGVKWEINGQDIPADADLTSLDLGVTLNTSGIPLDVINAVTGDKEAVQLSLAHNGEFGFTLTLTAPVGVQNKGLWANLYHYDTTLKQMLFETAAQVDASGNVALKFTHASEYAIVLDESSHELPFTDVGSKSWYTAAVQYVYQHGIMTGTGATAFAPDATLSRAMVAQILYNLEGQPAVEGESTFTDVSGHWAIDAITWAQKTGVVDGYENNTFRPNQAVTREELAQMLYNYAKVMGYDLTASGDLTAFPDGSKVSSWAKEAMAWATGNKLINGHDDGTLEPGGNSTRAQAASILMNFDLNLAN